MAKSTRKRRRRWRWRRVPTPLAYLVGALVGGAAFALVFLLSGERGEPRSAARDPLRTAPGEYAWAALPEPAFPIPPYARFLKGVKIVLDPGHVGQRDPGGNWKRGPTGLREAEANLRVAQFLREFLAAAEADVCLTREVDRSLDLPDDDDLDQRAQVANERRADLFLSIHHNANGNPQPNYTSVFYHGTPDDSAASLAAGRHLVAGLNDALRLETHLECALLSDYAVYPGKGFRVLRQAEVPALLSEASFHSNPAEEARLRDPVYNRREAYGLFLGLARWAQAGLPRVRLVKPNNNGLRRGAEVVIALDDGLSSRGGWGSELSHILRDSIVVRLDGRTLDHAFDAEKRQVRVTIPKNHNGQRGTLWVDFANVCGQHVLHPRLDVSFNGR